MTGPRDTRMLSCEEFQALLPELIGSGEDINLHPHMHSCALCRELLADLETIAEAARQLFPTVEPPDELWSQIESAIQKEEQSGGHGAAPSEAEMKTAESSTGKA
jgi:hypothetical protein